MRAAVSLVASAASLCVAYAQLWRHPEDLALACAAFAATFLLVHYAVLATTTISADGSPSSSGSGGDDDVDHHQRAPMKRLALVMALVLYGLACAEVWGAATSREVAVAALASWCCAAVLLFVYLVVLSSCGSVRNDGGTTIPCPN